MSSIVSRSPPPSGSTSQENDFFWISIRLGTSRTFSSRAKLRRGRGASTEAKTATPQGVARRTRERALGGAQSSPKARPSKIAQGVPDPPWGRSALTDPARPGVPYVAGRAQWTAATIGRVPGSVARPSGFAKPLSGTRPGTGSVRAGRRRPSRSSPAPCPGCGRARRRAESGSHRASLHNTDEEQGKEADEAHHNVRSVPQRLRLTAQESSWNLADNRPGPPSHGRPRTQLP